MDDTWTDTRPKPYGLRDRFAEVALTHLLGSRLPPMTEDQLKDWTEQAARKAYSIADAMMRARAGTQAQEPSP